MSVMHDETGSLIIDAEIDRLLIRMEQAERLMLRALHEGDHIRAARYRRMCASACAACMDLMQE